jgi:hypothetical protein
LGRAARFHAERLLAPSSQTQDRIGLRQNENCCISYELLEPKGMKYYSYK